MRALARLNAMEKLGPMARTLVGSWSVGERTMTRWFSSSEESTRSGIPSESESDGGLAVVSMAAMLQVHSSPDAQRAVSGSVSGGGGMVATSWVVGALVRCLAWLHLWQ
jgi:sugar phosphate permease